LSTPSPGVFFKIQGSAADGVGQVLAAGDMLGHAIPGTNTTYDLAIGAPLEGGSTGAVYVILGRTSNSFPATMNLPTDANARYGGIDPGDEAGRSLQIIYLDKDKFADLVVGAPKAAGPGNARAQAGNLRRKPRQSGRAVGVRGSTITAPWAGWQEGARWRSATNRDGPPTRVVGAGREARPVTCTSSTPARGPRRNRPSTCCSFPDRATWRSVHGVCSPPSCST
jgi:hypothetical protein